MLRTGVVHSSQVSFIGTETLEDRHGIINLPSTCHRTAATDDDALAVSPHRFPATYLERLAADRPNNGEPQYEDTKRLKDSGFLLFGLAGLGQISGLNF